VADSGNGAVERFDTFRKGDYSGVGFSHGTPPGRR
jgi:hypothetical protein